MHDLFKNAARVHTRFAIIRYLISNAYLRWDGAEKAQRHDELCRFYVAAVRGCDPDLARRDFTDDWEKVHTATAALTDHLDTAIGFPTDSTPDYDRLTPLFFERFHALAMEALAEAIPDQQDDAEVFRWFCQHWLHEVRPNMRVWQHVIDNAMWAGGIKASIRSVMAGGGRG